MKGKLMIFAFKDVKCLCYNVDSWRRIDAATVGVAVGHTDLLQSVVTWRSLTERNIRYNLHDQLLILNQEMMKIYVDRDASSYELLCLIW